MVSTTEESKDLPVFHRSVCLFKCSKKDLEGFVNGQEVGAEENVDRERWAKDS